MTSVNDLSYIWLNIHYDDDLLLNEQTSKIVSENIEQFKLLPTEIVSMGWINWCWSNRPTESLRFMLKSGILKYYNSLYNMRFYYIMEDVVDLIQCTDDLLLSLGYNKDINREVVMLSALFLYAGRVDDNGNDLKHKYSYRSANAAKKFLVDIGMQYYIDLVGPLVEYGASPIPTNNKLIRRLIRDLGGCTNVKNFSVLSLAEKEARSVFIDKGKFDHIQLVADEMLAAQKPQKNDISPLINGNMVMSTLGIPPGKQVGMLVNTLYEAQLNGVFNTVEEGIKILKESV